MAAKKNQNKYHKVIDFWRDSTPEMWAYFIYLIKDHVRVPIPAKNEKGEDGFIGYGLDLDHPCCIHENMININTELFKEKTIENVAKNN